MKRIYLISSIAFLLGLLHISVVFAELPDYQLQKYISQNGLTEDILNDYLSVNDLSLEDFETIDELVTYLGEPINEDTLQTLLTKHSLNKEELENILGGFGESIQDYLFIKDLETTVDFYLYHAEVLAEAEHMLSEIGLTQDEIDNLFMHFLTLDEGSLDYKMKSIRSDLEKYFSYNSDAKLTTKQQKELLSLYDTMIDTFGLIPNYYLLNKESKLAISYTDLISKNSLDGSDLLVELYNQDNKFLLDIKLTGDMLASDFILERGEKLLTVATVANEMSISVRGDKLPDTASPIGNIIILSIILILIGSCTLLITKRKALI